MGSSVYVPGGTIGNAKDPSDLISMVELYLPPLGRSSTELDAPSLGGCVTRPLTRTQRDAVGALGVRSILEMILCNSFGPKPPAGPSIAASFPIAFRTVGADMSTPSRRTAIGLPKFA